MTYFWNFEDINTGRICWRMILATEAEAEKFALIFNTKTAYGKKHPIRLIKDIEYPVRGELRTLNSTEELP